MYRRALLSLASIALALPMGSVHANNWPAKSIRIVVPAGQGGSADPLARLVAGELEKALKQPIVVDNKPGANGNIGATSVVRSLPDGYTLLFGWTGTLVPAVTMYGAKQYHPEKDLDPIVLIASVPNVIVVQPSLGVKSFPELVDVAKKNPETLNFGSTGSGSSYHLSGELFKQMMGVSMVHIPYSSPAAVFTDLVGDRLQLAFPGITAAAPLVNDNRLRAIAVMADKRSTVMPDVPTTTEVGQPGLKSETWFALLAPKGTPADVRKVINEAVNTALGTAEFRDKLTTMGFTPMGGTEKEFARTLNDDIKKWGEVVKLSGLKLD